MFVEITKPKRRPAEANRLRGRKGSLGISRCRSQTSWLPEPIPRPRTRKRQLSRANFWGGFRVEPGGRAGAGWVYSGLLGWVWGAYQHQRRHHQHPRPNCFRQIGNTHTEWAMHATSPGKQPPDQRFARTWLWKIDAPVCHAKAEHD